MIINLRVMNSWLGRGPDIIHFSRDQVRKNTCAVALFGTRNGAAEKSFHH